MVRVREQAARYPPNVATQQRFLIDTWETPEVEPMAGAAEYPIRPDPHHLSDLEDATKLMNNRGGNVVRWLPGRHTGSNRARGGVMPPGVDGRPNTFTGDPGHELASGTTGQVAYPTIDLAYTSHWHAVGNNIVASEYAGIRVQATCGSATHPIRVWGNTIGGVGHAGIIVQGGWRAPWEPSVWVDVAGNTISGDPTATASPYREGVYVGTGYKIDPDGAVVRPEWVDLTRQVTVRANRIRGLPSDGIEIKTGVIDFEVSHNEISNIRLVAGTPTTSIPVGAGITVEYANTHRPGGPLPVRGVVRCNRVFDIRSAGGGTRAPIVIGRGGIAVQSNMAWDFDHKAAIEIGSGRGGMGAGPIVVEHNTADRAVVHNRAGYDQLVERGNVPDQSLETFVGPETGSADAGWGPGSGFQPGDPTAPWEPPVLLDATGTPYDPPHPGALPPAV